MLTKLLSLTASMVCRGEKMHSSTESSSADAATVSMGTVTNAAINVTNQNEGNNAPPAIVPYSLHGVQGREVAQLS